MSTMFYKQPAVEWNEALPLGNGSLGAMVFGDAAKELVQLNQDTLWSGKPNTIEKEGAYEAFEEAKGLTFEGKYEEAHQLLSEKFLCGFSQSYLPFGDLHMEFALDGEVKDYKRSLDLANALLMVEYTCAGVAYKREYFVSFPDDVMAMRLSAAQAGKLNVRLSMESPLKNVCEAQEDTYILDGECPGLAGTKMPDHQKDYIYSEEPEKRGVQFRGGMKVLNQGGQMTCSEEGITVDCRIWKAKNIAMLWTMCLTLLQHTAGRSFWLITRRTINRFLTKSSWTWAKAVWSIYLRTNACADLQKIKTITV